MDGINVEKVTSGVSVDLDAIEAAPLPDDVLGALVSFLCGSISDFITIMRLRFTSRRYMYVIPRKITSVILEYIRGHYGAPIMEKVLSTLAQLPSLPMLKSLKISVYPPTPELALVQNCLAKVAPWLQRLTVFGLSDKLRGLLFSYKARLPIFPNLTNLDVSILYKTEKSLSFALFPKLDHLRICCPIGLNCAYFHDIIRDLPQLRLLTIQSACVRFADIEKLRGLANLESVSIIAMSAAPHWAAVADRREKVVSTSFYRNQCSSRGEAISRLNEFLDLIQTVSPVGLALDLGSDVSSFIRDQPLCLEKEIIAYYIQAGCGSLLQFSTQLCRLVSRHASMPTASSAAGVSVIEMLVKNGFDLGCPYNFKKEPILHLLFERMPSRALFELVFETPLVSYQGARLTPFEYSRALHLDYPFFWETPLFMLVRGEPIRNLGHQINSNAIETMQYILDNRERLLPLFDSANALGGPKTPSICVEHGADPWDVDSDGDTLLAHVPRHISFESFDILFKHPSFNPHHLNKRGKSHLDVVLTYGSRGTEVSKALVGALLDANVRSTEFTADLLASDYQFDSNAARLLALLEPDHVSHVVHNWVFSPVSTVTDEILHLPMNILQLIDIPALELQMLQDEDIRNCLAKHCVWGRGKPSLEILFALVEASPLKGDILALWANYQFSPVGLHERRQTEVEFFSKTVHALVATKDHVRAEETE